MLLSLGLDIFISSPAGQLAWHDQQVSDERSAVCAVCRQHVPLGQDPRRQRSRRYRRLLMAEETGRQLHVKGKQRRWSTL